MTVEIRVPTLGESVTEATVAGWTKKPGDKVAADEVICSLETDKVAVDVPAPAAGVLTEIVAKDGDTVGANGLLGYIDPSGKAAATAPAPAAKPAAAPAPAPAAKPAAAPAVMPSAQKIAADAGIATSGIAGTGKDGRVTKGDVLGAIENKAPAAAPAAPAAPRDLGPREERVKMSRLRQTIARRLKDAQNTAAMLTTFNEVDMSAVMGARNRYKDIFEKKHGVKLGFMSFFVKACVTALQEIPAVNAEIDGTDIIYKNHYDVGVAVGTPNGLVVPVVRDAEAKGFAALEKEIAELGLRARDGKLKIEELQGGTFTISNGGVFGSLMSTPILNPPQSGVLGMHRIEERPVVKNGEIVIRPMMYLALSYDHRLIDGREAVTFLVRVKEAIEDPARLLLDM